jgi:PAS domain-containing protein
MQQTILLLQENERKAAVVQELLDRSKRKRFVIEWLRSCDTALERLTNGTQQDVAAILMDLGSAEGPPLEIFDRIHAAVPHVPILVLSGPEHEAVAEQAVRRGAQDYILDTQLDGYSLMKAVRNMLERAAIAEASFVEKERAQVTLNSIGDAVISTDVAGRVTYLNHVAESMTGWSSAEALGRSFGDVFQIIDSTCVEHTTNPIAEAMQENRTVGLAPGLHAHQARRPSNGH